MGANILQAMTTSPRILLAALSCGESTYMYVQIDAHVIYYKGLDNYQHHFEVHLKYHGAIILVNI